MSLTITSPNTDRSLLTLSELRDAVGNIGDAKLTTLGNRVSALITEACNVARAGAIPPTLRLETVTETLRPEWQGRIIFLSRRPIVEVTSVVENATTLAATDYEILAPEGILQRLSGDTPTRWAAAKTVITYSAGWETVPHTLKELASKLAVVLSSEGGRDPSLGSVTVPGVISETYRFGQPDDPLIPAEIMEGLERGGYVNKVLA